jgi:cold shock CspA family protein
MPVQGRVASEPGNGVWFLECDGTSQTVFCHHSNVANSRYLHVNDRVEFELAPNPRKPGQVQAVNVRFVGRNIARQTSGMGAQS